MVPEEKGIMVVDDDKDILAVTEMYLHEWGWNKVKAFSDPFQALDDFKAANKEHRDDYALIISDVRMPGMDGWNFANKIQEIRPDCKIVLMSAYDKDIRIHDSRPEVRYEQWLQKPFGLDQFCMTVRKATNSISTATKTRSRGH
jgi:CheY-like chemotaxis protein